MIKLSLLIVACVALTIDGTHQPDNYKKDQMPYKTNNQYASVSYGKAYASKVQKTVKYVYPSTIYKQSKNKMYPTSYQHVYSKPIYASKNQVYTPTNNQYKPVYTQTQKSYKKTYFKPSSQYQHPYSSNDYQQQHHQNYEAGKDYNMNDYKKQDTKVYDSKDYHKKMPVYNQKKETVMYATPKYQQQNHQNYEAGKDYNMNEYYMHMPAYNQKEQKINTYQQQYKPAYDNMKKNPYKMNDYGKHEVKKSQDYNRYGSMDHNVQEYKKYSHEKYDREKEYVYKKKDLNGMKEQPYIKEYPVKTKYYAQPDMKTSYNSQYPSVYKSNDMYQSDKKYQAYKFQNDYNKIEDHYQQKQQHGYDCSGMKPLPGDCYKFVMCTSGKSTIMKCPSNLVYDEHNKICNHRHMVKGKCGSGTSTY